MSTRPSVDKAKAAANSKERSEQQAASRRMEGGVVAGESAYERLRKVNAAVEWRLAQAESDLAAARGELSREREGREQERITIANLEEKLGRQKIVLDDLHQELESLGYSISHDLTAPLRHVVGFSSVLLEDFRESLDDTAQGYLDCIVRAGRKMEVLIEALLGLSRITRQEFTPATVDLSRLAQECAVSLKEAAPERKVAVTIAADLAVRGDAALIRAAMQRLFDNAWKYTRNREAASIEFGSMRRGDDTVFFLRDNGAGFDMRFADKLFGAFQRMHRESDFEGTGVGLAAVQRIIHRHGGKIWADATVDGGATFYFTLPE